MADPANDQPKEDVGNKNHPMNGNHKDIPAEYEPIEFKKEEWNNKTVNDLNQWLEEKHPKWTNLIDGNKQRRLEKVETLVDLENKNRNVLLQQWLEKQNNNNDNNNNNNEQSYEEKRKLVEKIIKDKSGKKYRSKV